MIKDFENLVREFHLTFECPIFDNPERAPLAIHKLRSRLIKEELREYYHASFEVEKLDALCDLLYVVLGTVVTYSTPITYPCWYKDSRNTPLGTFIRPLTDELDCGFPCQKNLSKECCKTMLHIDCLGKKYKLDHAFIAVHENNMSKLWDQPSHDPSLISTPKGKKWLVRDQGGKIIKPSTHKKVDLFPYL